MLIALATPTISSVAKEWIVSAEPTFGAPLVGQTERALAALLDRELVRARLTAPHWVTLTVATAGGGSGGRDQLARRVAEARKVGEAEVQVWIDELTAARLLRASDEGAPVTVTDHGRQLHRQIGSAVAEVTKRLWGDLTAEELTTAARVLGTVLARANEQLADARD